jgi:FMN phosphatase YigB (HAD superfamily)
MREGINDTKSRPFLKRNLKERLVLFVDLDHTLYNSSEARKNAAMRAIKRLNMGKMQTGDAFKKYEKIVANWVIFNLVGFPNFRFEWNRREIYEILLALTNNEIFQEEIDKLEEKIQKIETNSINEVEKQRLIADEVKTFEKKEETKKFRKNIKIIENDVEIQSGIDNAVKEFERTQLKLLNDARDFLETLNKNGIEIYIVTEGNTKTQLEKVRKLGLTDLVGLNRVIVDENKSVEFYFRAVHIASENEPIKLTVVGDRYDKDIAPLIELFGDNVITIRVLYGKYKKEYSDKELEKKKLPKPTVTVNTLTEAKNILIKNSTWAHVNKINVKGIKR